MNSLCVRSDYTAAPAADLICDKTRARRLAASGSASGTGSASRVDQTQQPVDAACRAASCKNAAYNDQAGASAFLIRPETALMSVPFGNFALSKPMTLPMSCGPAAPEAVTAAATSAAISASDRPAGM